MHLLLRGVLTLGVGAWVAVPYFSPERSINPAVDTALGLILVGYGLWQIYRWLVLRSTVRVLEISSSELRQYADDRAPAVRISCQDVVRVRWEADDRACLHLRGGGYKILSLRELSPHDFGSVRDELSRVLPHADHERADTPRSL